MWSIQEDKNDDAQFAVILPKALDSGEQFTVTPEYQGKEAVINEGGGNYFPVARDNWYPNNSGGGLGEYVTCQSGAAEYVYGTQLPAYKLDASFDIGLAILDWMVMW